MCALLMMNRAVDPAILNTNASMTLRAAASHKMPVLPALQAEASPSPGGRIVVSASSHRLVWLCVSFVPD